MEVKPIFCVGICLHNPDEFYRIFEDLKAKMPEYHILVYPIKSGEAVFNAFYEKPINNIDFEELKQLVITELKK
jgi:flavoprotein